MNDAQGTFQMTGCIDSESSLKGAMYLQPLPLVLNMQPDGPLETLLPEVLRYDLPPLTTEV
jgi:hypothetical protein